MFPLDILVRHGGSNTVAIFSAQGILGVYVMNDIVYFLVANMVGDLLRCMLEQHRGTSK
jgi:hypothetical protein